MPIAAPGGNLRGIPDVIGVRMREHKSADSHALVLENLANEMTDAGGRIDNKGSARPRRDEHKPIRRVERRRNHVQSHVTPWTTRSA